MDWEKIFANDVTNKDLISKQLIQFNNSNRKAKQPNKMRGRPKLTFSNEDIQMANRHMKGCST